MKVKTIPLFFILITFVSACASTKDEGGYHIKSDGWFELENMSQEQLKQKAAEWNMTLEQLLEEKNKRYDVNITGIITYRFFIDPICFINHIIKGDATVNPPINVDSLVIITPNPTSSSTTCKLLASISNSKWRSQWNGNKDIFPLYVEFQLIVNQKIIHQWINANCKETETIPDEYLKEAGVYTLVCNFTGPTGCTASASSIFKVIKN